MFESINTEQIGETVVQAVITYGTKILLAIIVLMIGMHLVKHLVKAIHVVMKKSKIDPALEGFLCSLLGVTLKILLVIMVMSTMGVEMTSFVAILGAAGLAIGLALQGSLSNFAGGALILFFKPFSVGDKIEASGYTGVVKEIQIFNTILETADKQKVIIPNGELSNHPVINITGVNALGVEVTFGIGYGDDIDKAKLIIKDVIESHEKVLKDPTYVIGVIALADSSVNIFTRSFARPNDYWDVLFDITETVKKRFDQEGISIPFPQRDVHIHNS